MMDLNANGDSSPQPNCSICLEPVGDQRTRSIAKLHCGHDFHLDCIGSAFNAKGTMQCPNCRKVERGRWLYASGPNHNNSSSEDFEWLGDDIYGVQFSEVPIGFHWCPIRGFTQITSVIEQEEHQPFTYYDMMGNNSAMGGDHAAGSSSTNSQNGCPYMAQHSMHAPSSSSAPMDTRPIHESTTQLFHYRSVPAFSGTHPGVELMNPHGFPAEIISTVPLAEHQIPQFGIRMPNNRTDAVGPHRVPLLPVLPAYSAGSVPVPRSGNAVGSTVAIVTPTVAEVRTNHSRGSSGSTASATGHIYQPAVHATNPSLLPIRRVRPRNVTFFSSVSAAATTTTAGNNVDMAGLYSLSVAGSADRAAPPDSQNIGRHMDRLYAHSGREGPTQLPWIPLEGESQWWGPFNPTQNVQNLAVAGFGQRASGERVPQGRSDNGYPHMGSSRMQPPYM